MSKRLLACAAADQLEAAPAVAICDSRGAVVAALSISTPVGGVRQERIAPCLEQLKAAAGEVSKGLGYSR